MNVLGDKPMAIDTNDLKGSLQRLTQPGEGRFAL
jgi:hypothetical protein